MKKRTRRILSGILLLIAIFAAVRFAQSVLESRRSQEDYQMALEIAGGHAETEETVPETAAQTEPVQDEIPETEPAPPETEPPMPDDPVIEELMALDLEALREVNEDVIGWIQIPDTAVTYPLLQWTDNDFYLHHTWQQHKNGAGSIFMDYQSAPDFSDFNTIIYGHNMRNGTMFSSLRSYAVPGYWEKHPYFYIRSDAGVARYDIFAIQSVSTDSIIYGLGIDTTQRKQQFLRFAADYSLVDTGLMPTTDDSIVTLSTCTGNGHAHRWVVIGMLNEEASYLPGR